jgi:hypothetical protein
MAYGIPHTIWTQALSFLSIACHVFTSCLPRRIVSPRSGAQALTEAQWRPIWAPESRSTTAASGELSSIQVCHVIRCMTRDLGNNHERVHAHAGAAEGWLAVDAGTVARSAGRAVVAVESGPAPSLVDAPFCFLAEKSVSTGRWLDNRCCVDHTVVYLIRYAIL